jgi:hypothetical protein
MNELKDIFQLFFMRTQFLERATIDSLSKELKRNDQFREKYAGLNELPTEVKDKTRTCESDRADAIRRSYT